MKKLSTVDGNVAMTLDKLPAIRGDLVRTDPEWEKWDFAKLSEAVRLWTTRNPIDQNRTGRGKEKQVFVGRKSREYVCCGEKSTKRQIATK